MVEPHKELEEILEGRDAEEEPEQPKAEPEQGQGEEDVKANDEADKEGQDDSQNQAPEPEAKTVPLQALLQVRSELKQVKDEKERLERQYQQQMQHMQNAQAMMMQQQAKPQEKNEPEIDIWDDPDKYIQSKFETAQQQMQQSMQMQKEQISRFHAEKAYGHDIVAEAEKELEAYVRSDPNGTLEAKRMSQSQDPYGDLVNWHKQRKALQAIGNDPQAWIEQQREALLNDQDFLTKAAQKLQSSQPVQAQAVPQAMPTSFSKAPSQNKRAVQQWPGQKSMNEILGR